MVDVDDAVAVLLAEPFGKDLHVAAENRQRTGDGADFLAHSAKGSLLNVGIHRDWQVEKVESLFLDGLTEYLVIGDHQGDLDVQLPETPAPEDVSEAVILLAD